METKRQEDIRKLMQMPEEAIASLNESERQTGSETSSHVL